MMQLEVVHEGATPAELEAALRAATAVFAAADVDPMAAWGALAMEEDWDDRGFPEDAGLTPTEQRAVEVFSEAQVAACEVLNCPPGRPAMLSFREV